MEHLIDRVTRDDPDVTEALLYNFRHDDITEDQTLRLIQGLRRNPHVTSINFYHATATPQVCQEMSLLFRENTAIEHAKVPKGMTNAQLAPFCLSLRENTTVKHLDLGSCDICGREGGEIVAGVLQFNTSITIIDLYANEWLGPEGASQIADALRVHNRTLKKLYLASCGIGNVGARRLWVALQQNNALEVVSVVNDRITKDGLSHLAESLPSMKGLLKLYFDWYGGVSPQVVQSVVQGLLGNDSLIYVRGDGGPGTWKYWTTCSKYATALNQVNKALLGDEGSRQQHGPRADSVIPLGVPVWPYLLDWCNHQSNDFRTTAHPLEEEELSEVQLSLTFHVLRHLAEEIFGKGETQAETQTEAPSETHPKRQTEAQMEGQRETMTETPPETQTEAITEVQPVQEPK